MNLYTRKKIIHKIVLLLFVLIGLNAFGQNAVLVREAVQDSSEYFGNLKNVNDDLFYTGGKTKPPQKFYYCGSNVRPADYREAHVYKYDIKQDESGKLFHHDFENAHGPCEMRRPDSSMIYHNRTFFPFSDTSGVFVNDYGTKTSNYWIKNGDNYKEIVLPGKNIGSMFYKHTWFDGKLLVSGSDSLVGTKLWYVDTSGFQLKLLLSDTLTYSAGICDFYDEHIIFEGFSRAYDDDFGLFVADKKGTIRRLGSYPLATVKPYYVGIFKGKIMYTLTGRGFKNNYKNEYFTNTVLWEYDIENNTSKKIYDFGKYGLVYSAYEHNDDLYFTFGNKEHKMYKLSEGDISKNDKSGTLKHIPYYPLLIDFNNKKYFIGIDNEEVRRLYTLNKKDKIKLIDDEYSHIKRIHRVEDRLIFIIKENDHENCLKFYQIKKGSNEIEHITDECLTGKYYDYLCYRIFTVRNDIYVVFRYDLKAENETDKIDYSLSYEERQPIRIDLFRLEGAKLKLIKSDIRPIRNTSNLTGFIDMTIIKDDLYIVSRANKKDSFNQLWKITNDTN